MTKTGPIDKTRSVGLEVEPPVSKTKRREAPLDSLEVVERGRKAEKVPELMKTPKPKSLREGAERIAKTLRAAGYDAYFAGGCVRDGLLGQEPKDYDIVTDAEPDEVNRLFRRTVQVGASFGVVKVLLSRKFEYEVATYRKDGDYSDGRRPDQVVYSKSREEDVNRRDFTINALLEDPETKEILDYVGGRADLEAKLIRAVGAPKLRVAEDRLRMLRAVRFAARFGFELEEQTKQAVVEHAAEITEVSAERITMELEGIWSCARPGLGLELLKETRLLGHVLPFVDAADVEARSEQLARLPSLHRDPESTRLIGWALLFEGMESKAIDEAMRKMKMSREQIRSVKMLAEAAPILRDPAAAPIAEVRRLLVSREADLYADFQKALLGEGKGVSFLEGEKAELERDPLPELPLVTGADLKDLGLRPGPHFKQILDQVTQAVLERRITSKAEGLALSKELARKLKRERGGYWWPGMS